MDPVFILSMVIDPIKLIRGPLSLLKISESQEVNAQ